MSSTFKATRKRLSNKEHAKRQAGLRKLDLIRQEAAKFENRMLADMYTYSCEQQIVNGNSKFMEFMGELDQTPVSIEEFLDSDEFIGGTDITLWPETRKSLINLHSDWYKGKAGNCYEEAIFGGSTGNSKTFQSIVSFLYEAYILGCLKNPQKVYGLSGSTGIIMAIFAAKPAVMRKAVYMPLRGLMEQIPWFRKYMPWDETLKSEIYFFKQNMRIVPAGLDADAVVGEAVIKFLIDEANFFPVVKQSKKVLATESDANGGRSSEYDQVQILYDTVSRRRDSRFTYRGPHVGIGIVSSSKKYTGDFTDRRIEYVNNYHMSNVYIYDKPQYQVVPQDRFCGKKFKISVSAEANSGIVIHEDINEAIALRFVEYILPIEYLEKFRKSPYGALRDIIGIASTAISPFFTNRLKIVQTVERAAREGYASFLRQDNVKLATYGLPMVIEDHLCRDPHTPRSVHIDLSSTEDFCSIAMAKFGGMVTRERPGGVIEILPTFIVEMLTNIEPDHEHPIDVADIRAWTRSLKTLYRYPLTIVTYDTYASVESVQAWRKQGVKSGTLSMVRDTKPFKDFREMLEDDRITFCENGELLEQMFTLEYDAKTGKIDHVYGGHSDAVHALVGSVTNLARNPALMHSLVDSSGVVEEFRPGDTERSGAGVPRRA